ncbi:uncharacterized protein BX663DRAFT_492569 [Cokeromyces recurvatus]|uniref:uncharacterized protein n=1 Tax=Cokeromyces recurvatus TaxID=90255 RepID=UPI00221ED2A8|nr:uncharacterized protein BX663DRAFT_492569 [Cokeromyces recurvatus]KAI7907962.1 hypothetical protein BX663DRAFT_492569 [Cokeromyces recurvatus]
MYNKWDIRPRIWCKYCKKFITNNKPSIQIHENGGAHKAAVESFLRNVYKKGRQEKEEEENIRCELQRIESAALNAVGIAERSKYSSTSVASPSQMSTSSKSTRSTTTTYNSPVYIPTIDELRQQAEDEKNQAERAKLEGREEWAVNTQVAKVGEWEIIAQPSVDSTAVNNQSDKNKTKPATTHDQTPEFQDDDEEDEEDLHNFKIKEKELPVDIDNAPGDGEKEEITFKKRKLGGGDSIFKPRKKKPLRKKD